MLTCTPGEPWTSRGLQGGGQLGQNQAEWTCLSEVGMLLCGRTLGSCWTHKDGVGGHTKVRAGEELPLALDERAGQTHQRMRPAHTGGCTSSVLDQQIRSLWEASKSQPAATELFLIWKKADRAHVMAAAPRLSRCCGSQRALSVMVLPVWVCGVCLGSSWHIMGCSDPPAPRPF